MWLLHESNRAWYDTSQRWGIDGFPETYEKYGIVTFHNNKNHEGNLSQDSLIYFVFLYIN